MSILGLTMAGLGNSLGSGISSGITSAASGMMTGAINGIFGGIRAKKQHKRNKEILALQSKYEQERMELQAEMNKEQAQFNQGLAKEMYDYTFKNEAEYNDPKNQRARMEAAGLNPALMYGGSAAGAGGVAEGSTGGAGAAGPVTALQPMGLQVALQAESQKAQIELAQSQAAKNYAEAGKITGIDTEIGRKSIEEADARILKTSAEAAKTNEEIKEVLENVAGKKIQNWINSETKEEQVDTVVESLNILYQKAAMNVIEAEKNEKEIKILKNDIDSYEKKLQAILDEVENGKTSAEAAMKQADNAAKMLEQNAPKTQSETIKNYATIATGVIGAIIMAMPGGKYLKRFFKK